MAIVVFNPPIRDLKMTQTTNRLFDDFAKLMTDAAGAADGLKKETEALFRSQSEKFLRDMNVVTREDFEAVREMAQKARQENEALTLRIAALEAEVTKLSLQGSSTI
jgi:BMFP domain-containing protein YqiC